LSLLSKLINESCIIINSFEIDSPFHSIIYRSDLTSVRYQKVVKGSGIIGINV
jgi:hypothetical protein